MGATSQATIKMLLIWVFSVTFAFFLKYYISSEASRTAPQADPTEVPGMPDRMFKIYLFCTYSASP